MAGEQVYPASTPVGAGGGLVASSFQYYLTGDESIRVTVTTLSAAANYEIAWRYWRQADRTVQFTRDTLRTPDPGPQTVVKNYPLVSGALMNLRIGAGAGPIFYGVAWVQVQLVRGFSGATEIIATLLQGYLSHSNDLCWPGSPIEKQDQASGFITTAIQGIVGAVATWTVPSGERWTPTCGQFSFTAGGVVGNRYPSIAIIDGAATTLYTCASENPITAGNGSLVSFGAGVALSTVAGIGVIVLTFPTGIELSPGCKVVATAVGALAGDVVFANALQIRTRLDG